MAEYITKVAAIEAVEDSGIELYQSEWNEIEEKINAMHAADVVPVVRCKDCVHWDDDPDTYGADYGPKGKCMKSFETMCADDFCSYGERKDGGADNG